MDSHKEQRINPREAAIVRRIFELAAQGVAQPRIAKLLNAEGVLTPRAQQGRPCAWVQSSVHAVLHRPRYKGDLVWNRTSKCDRWGQHHQIDRDPREWITVHVPDLQIISDDLWQAAHAKIASVRSVTNIRASRDRDSKYLLPGLARCAWCNGGIRVRTRTRSGGRRLHYYACTSHFDRGASVCRNLVQVPMEAVDERVIRNIANLLRPDLVTRILAGVRAEMQPDQQQRRREKIEQQLAALDRQATNLAKAIAMTGNVAVLVAELHAVEQQRKDLMAQRDALGDMPPPPDWRLMERQARKLLDDWRGLLCRNTADARPVLRQLLKSALIVTPILEEDRRGFQFEGHVEVGELLTGYVGRDNGVPGQN